MLQRESIEELWRNESPSFFFCHSRSSLLTFGKRGHETNQFSKKKKIVDRINLYFITFDIFSAHDSNNYNFGLCTFLSFSERMFTADFITVHTGQFAICRFISCQL